MDPFGVLGVPRDADEDSIRRAFRTRARLEHPDTGGDASRMTALLDAYKEALSLASRRTGPQAGGRVHGSRAERDVASFTVDALPVVAHEALLMVAAMLGDVAEDEPPYLLEFLIRDGGDVWCRCDLVPDAGSTTVSVTVSPAGDEPLVRCEQVRDLIVAELNELSWD
ncbi:MAG: hypothetical protein RL573_542 [Actinomycetota bacterium]|nr:J domain-containing protein [Actinomycetota bacterium]